MPDDRITHTLTDDEAEPRTAEAESRLAVDERRTVGSVQHEVTSPDPMAAAHRAGEVSVMMQPIRLRQHPSARGE
jgi:hypothetical protein